MRGSITRVSRKDGSGSILAEDGKEVSFERSGINSNGAGELRVGHWVEFELQYGFDQPYAMNVPQPHIGDSHPLRSEPGSPRTGIPESGKAIMNDWLLPPIIILRLRNMTAIDSTGLQALENFADRVHESGRQLILCGAREQPLLRMREAEFHEHVGAENICRSLANALERARILCPGGATQRSGGVTWERRSTDVGSNAASAVAASTPER